MSEIGTERVEPTVRLPERLGNEPRAEPRGRPKRPRGADFSPHPDDDAETPPHQIDSLA